MTEEIKELEPDCEACLCCNSPFSKDEQKTGVVLCADCEKLSHFERELLFRVNQIHQSIDELPR
jgi:hypothetical protein